MDMSSMEGVWVSAEHQCAIWCNQLASKIGAMIVEESQQLLHALQWPARGQTSERERTPSNVQESKDSSELQNAVSTTHLQLWNSTRHTATPELVKDQDFWNGDNPIVLPPQYSSSDTEQESSVLSCKMLSLDSPQYASSRVLTLPVTLWYIDEHVI